MAAFQMPKLLAAVQINQQIKTLAKDMSSIDVRVHALAVQCIMHAQEHGDVTLMQRLYQSLPNPGNKAKGVKGTGGYLVQGLTTWLRMYTPIRASAPDWKLKDKRTDADWKIQEAIEHPFWTLAEVSDAANKAAKWTEATLIQRIKSLMTQLEDRVSKGEFEGDPEHAKALMSNVIQAADKFEAASKVKEPKAVTVRAKKPKEAVAA